MDMDMDVDNHPVSVASYFPLNKHFAKTSCIKMTFFFFASPHLPTSASSTAIYDFQII